VSAAPGSPEQAVGPVPLDAMAPDQARSALDACLAAPGWVERLVAGRPHGDPAGWLAAGGAAFAALADQEVLAALSTHPRIGEPPSGGGPHARSSRHEQAGVGAAAADVVAQIAAGNRAYAERFDRVFLIRAAGRSAPEILAELQRRMCNDDVTELHETREQLRQITALRLEHLLGVAGAR
jgi:2-oxo-4-hydroxy-4-carboxy-5-ureidoimidazoline decarboxylase